MDVGNLLMKASENFSVRRAFGAAYEKDDMLIIPVAIVGGGGGGGTGAPTPETWMPVPAGPLRGTRSATTRHRRTRGAWTTAWASAGSSCPRAPTL
jgi:hypothetical protein